MVSGSILSILVLTGCGAPSGQGSNPVRVPGSGIPVHQSGGGTAQDASLVAGRAGLQGAPVTRRVEMGYRGSSWLEASRGVAMSSSGETAMLGVGNLSCSVDTISGDIEEDESYLPGDEEPTDNDCDDDGDDSGDTADTGSSAGGDTGDGGGDDDSSDDEDECDDAHERYLVINNDQAMVVGRARSLSWDVAGIVDAQFVHNGVIALSEGPQGCAVHVLTPQDRSLWPLPAAACGSELAVDHDTGTVWLANGDLWSVRGGVATLEAQGVGDRITFEPERKIPVTAYREGNVVTAHGLWAVQLQHAVRDLTHMGSLGGIFVMTFGDSASVNHLVALEGATGGVMMDQNAPGMDGRLYVSDNGEVAAIGMGSQTMFYTISVGSSR
ncbi:MAG TPA: hypothetical protein ENK18_04270 [Deltaproteobacteria bacterium]|nr:hypothetical protein [Deltaproteobacteria bacterium]